MISVSCLIPAAGLGERFRKTSSNLVSKLDLGLAGKTLLERTLKPFLESPAVKEIVLAVPPQKVSSFRKRFRGAKTVRIIPGGKTRTESVQNALKASNKKNPWVVVHDGARPLLDSKTLNAFLDELEKKKALILARPVYPTLKRAQGLRIESTVPRDNLWEAETPQGFRRTLLEKAYDHYGRNPFPATDEASLVERLGEPIFLFKNSKPNLKITDFPDYQTAQKFLGDSSVVKTGIGFDIHRLVKGRPLCLGGIRIPFSKGTLGHSDGDAVLHAVSDALLGAAALGDIGDYFSPRSRKTKGMDSSHILRKVYGFVKNKGYELVSCDINLLLEKPRLGALKDKMKKRIAAILEVPDGRINLKARTAEGLDAVGRGEAVSAQTIVTLVKHD